MTVSAFAAPRGAASAQGLGALRLVGWHARQRETSTPAVGSAAPMPRLTQVPRHMAGPDAAAVKELQRRLKAAGFDPGPADGWFGPRTALALRSFQAAGGMTVDGAAGPQTWAALGLTGAPRGETASPPPRPQGPRSDLTLPPVIVPPTPRPRSEGPTPGEEQALRDRLLAHAGQPSRGMKGKCLRYANDVIVDAGGHAVAGAARRSVRQTHEGRGEPVGNLARLAREGALEVGALIYANRQPGADPSSNDMSLGPHWFVYVGNGQFMDQYGLKSAAEMARFLPGRKIDTVFHPFG